VKGLYLVVLKVCPQKTQMMRYYNFILLSWLEGKHADDEAEGLWHAPESFGPIVLPFALLPAMRGDQGRVAVCGKFGGNATLFPLLNYHFEESF